MAFSLKCPSDNPLKCTAHGFTDIRMEAIRLNHLLFQMHHIFSRKALLAVTALNQTFHCTKHIQINHPMPLLHTNSFTKHPICIHKHMIVFIFFLCRFMHSAHKKSRIVPNPGLSDTLSAAFDLRNHGVKEFVQSHLDGILGTIAPDSDAVLVHLAFADNNFNRNL